METPSTVRLTDGARNALLIAMETLDGAESAHGLSTKPTPALIVEVALGEFMLAAERDPERAMTILIGTKLA